jgi:urease accessory protein
MGDRVMTGAAAPLSEEDAGVAPSLRTPASGQSHHGYGLVELEHRDGRTRAIRTLGRSPLKILNPAGPGRSAALYATTYGGGLVAGDRIDVTLLAGPDTTALWTTQSATKVYRAVGDRGCRQTLSARLGERALLIAWPDPLICFAGANYEQRQDFRLSHSASVVVVDCLSSGRRARGERWAFARYQSRTRISIDDRLVLEDALVLDPADGELNGPFRLGRFDAFATVILAGAGIEGEAGAILRAVDAERLQRRGDFLCSAGRCAAGIILRILARSPDFAMQYVREKLATIVARLDDDPLARKW